MISKTWIDEKIEDIKNQALNQTDKDNWLAILNERKAKKLKYTWAQFDIDLNTLASEIIKDENLKYITGIPRGGLPIAVALSHLTGLQYLNYTESQLLSPGFDKDYSAHLIVDDISDKGTTLKPYADLGYPIATLFCRKGSIVLPDDTVHFISDSRWILFPWEA